MYKINSIIFKLIIVSFLFHSTVVYAGIDEEFEFLLEVGQPSPNFFKNMETVIKDKTLLETLKIDEQNIASLMGIAKKAHPANHSEDDLQNFAEQDPATHDLISLLKNLHTAEKTSSDALNAATIPSSKLEEKNHTLYDLTDLLKKTRDAWVGLYQKERDQLNDGNIPSQLPPLNKAALLYCFKASKIANILRKQDMLSHQSTDRVLNFPEDCYKFAQQKTNPSTKQQLLVTGLRALKLKPCYFLPDSPEIATSDFCEHEEARKHLKKNVEKLQITIKILEELTENFMRHSELKPAEYLKTMCIVEDGHPHPASLYYKLMPLYKRLSNQNNICGASNNKLMKRSDFEQELSNRGFQALIHYLQALKPPIPPLAKDFQETRANELTIYHERILDIIDRVEKWVPETLRQGENLIYKTSRTASSQFLTVFYEEKAKNMKEQNLEWANYIDKAAIYVNTLDSSHKKKVSEHSPSYFSYIKANIMALPIHDVLPRVISMYYIAQETTDDTNFPPLEAILAPLYAKKSEDSQETEKEPIENPTERGEVSAKAKDILAIIDEVEKNYISMTDNIEAPINHIAAATDAIITPTNNIESPMTKGSGCKEKKKKFHITPKKDSKQPKINTKTPWNNLYDPGSNSEGE